VEAREIEDGPKSAIVDVRERVEVETVEIEHAIGDLGVRCARAERDHDFGAVPGVAGDVVLTEFRHVTDDPGPAVPKGLAADSVKSDGRTGGSVPTLLEQELVRIGVATVEADPAHADR
jgi:hypothetical protein